jgi:hypothetical protein
MLLVILGVIGPLLCSITELIGDGAMLLSIDFNFRSIDNLAILNVLSSDLNYFPVVLVVSGKELSDHSKLS